VKANLELLSQKQKNIDLSSVEFYIEKVEKSLPELKQGLRRLTFEAALYLYGWFLILPLVLAVYAIWPKPFWELIRPVLDYLAVSQPAP
jgi:hypothetical protein